LRVENTGKRCVAIGTEALESQDGDVTNVNNVAVGYRAGNDVTTGQKNTIIGSLAGNSGTNDLTTGDNNILLGFEAAASAADVSNEITLGDSNISAIRAQVTSISSLSDKRDKTNIEESKYGINFLNKLKPVTFTWNHRDNSLNKGKKDVGFIAQDLQEIDDEYTKLVYDSNPDKLEATYGRLIPILVKAVQELSEKVKELENK
jgi:hypothetical protein